MEQAIMIDTALAEALLQVKRTAMATGEKPNLTSIADESGINRAVISNIANGLRVATPSQAERLWEVLRANGIDGATDESEAAARQVSDPAPVTAAPASYKRAVELYETKQYRDAMGWCEYIRSRRKMGVMIGHPGTGKTTVLKSFCERVGAHYIECWPMMLMGDLLQEIATAMGIALPETDTVYQRTKKVRQALATRNDVMLVFDEAEMLTEDKGGVKKIEALRKLWDNTGTPIIFAGTGQLRSLIMRGGGGNLAQLSRRKYEIEMTGMSEKEVRAILREYNLTSEATGELSKIATDTKHGGLGNFVELLGLCLDAADGARIDAGVLAGAKRYKMLY